jgi:holo-ACP synthase/triphosphoribosyl-dephospho-CoA synthase
MNDSTPREITLAELLAAKDERAAMRAELRGRHELPIISMTVNMVGSVKYSADTVDVLYGSLPALRRQLKTAGLAVREERLLHSPGGPVAIIAVVGEPAVIKEAAVALENQLPYGRLLDIDVFAADGRQISRGDCGLPPRTCLLCSEPATACVRSAVHEQGAVLAAMNELVGNFRAEATRAYPQVVELIGSAALEAMLMEVACTPAPGLVDRDNSGAHRDMDIFTFIKSSSALAPAMYRCAAAGLGHEGRPAALLPILRRIGREAEKAMFAATDGVNTQKGLLFLMGVLAAATALACRRTPTTGVAEIVAVAAAICEDIVVRELVALQETAGTEKTTAGEKLYLRYGITGIRGELAAGLPAVLRTGLPAYRSALDAGLPINDALVHALIALMTVTEDTTIVHRHGPDTLIAVQKEATAVMAAGGMRTENGRRLIKELDCRYIHRNISPGGSADLLAATYFLHTVEERLGR